MEQTTLNRITAIDHLVGTRLRACRKLLRITLKEVARAAGVSVQQILKYENCINRVPISRLSRIADFMGKQVQYFVSSRGGDEKSKDSKQKKTLPG